MSAAAVQTALALVFTSDGATTLLWEQATRCDCFDPDTHQPQWGHAECGGLGAVYADPVKVLALFRSQGRWQSFRVEGQLPLGEAELTTPAFETDRDDGIVACKPNYVDDRIRDRFTVPVAIGDVEAGRVFYPASTPVPFLMGNTHLAWRVQLQSTEQQARLVPQP